MVPDNDRRAAPLSHVVLAAFPFGTHAAPLLALARRLAAAAPVTTFSFLSTESSLSSLRRTADIPSNLHLATMPADQAAAPGEGEMRAFIDAAAAGGVREGLKSVEAASSAPVTCLVTDAFLWMAAEVAAEVGVPWVPVWTAGPHSLSAHLNADLIRQTVGVCDDRVAFIPSLADYSIRDLPDDIVSGNVDSPISLLLHRMSHHLPNAAAIVVNAFHGLFPLNDAYLAAHFGNYLPLGPIHLLPQPSPNSQPILDPENCLSWLDRHGPSTVAYVSFGTVTTPPPHELTSLANGLEASGSPFLWSLRGKARELLPQGFLDRTRGRGLVVGWAPQMEVLRHVAVGAFVSHCGWNSVVESITGAVPMVCRPFFGDQHMNARAVSEIWRIGLVVDGGALSEEGMVAALNLVLRREEGKSMRERARELKAKAEHAVGAGGTSDENLSKLVKFVCGN
ncbi:anthocyanidin 3-O-glucosyltransferase 7-like [Typha angustifolia]|uniref:anthocyanidin 3-O-glucosyltransferase 7-like n=1 Tax=Typha angustifolia TaxID=59011 RepID=UPI003C2C2ED2